MTTEPQWQQARWREAQRAGQPAAPYARPAAGSARSTVAAFQHDPHWTSSPRSQHAGHNPANILSPSGPYHDASPLSSWPQRRHSLATGLSHGVHQHHSQLTNNPPAHPHGDYHRRLSHYDVLPAIEKRNADAPLTLQIPQTQDPSKTLKPLLTGHHAPDAHPQGSMQSSQPHPQTPLPSFASFQEQASSRSDELDEVEIAPMSSRLSCYDCSRMKPLLCELAGVTSELTEHIQACFNRSSTRKSDAPQDSLVRTTQWILDAIGHAKTDMRELARRTPSIAHQQLPKFASETPSRIASPSNQLKRVAERGDRDDQQLSKKARHDELSPDDLHHPLNASSCVAGRRASIDYLTKETTQRLGPSSPPTESNPAAGHPKQTTPTDSGRPFGALPSPSSLSCLPPNTSSLAPPTTSSIGSPTTSSHHAVSIHSMASSEATSEYLKDLQHKVTLKSLAHDTLQSEYANLLQKFQRERVKSRAIEKKTSVADQEVNELTTRNEDLVEQVKSLEVQLEESESKREIERANAAKEKEQWGRMLEMGGRLHAKHAEEKQKLISEKARLAEKSTVHEHQTPIQRPDQRIAIEASQSSADKGTNASNVQTEHKSPGIATSVVAEDEDNEPFRLKHENNLLRSRIETLKSSLAEAKRVSDEIRERIRQCSQDSTEISTKIQLTLQDQTSPPDDHFLNPVQRKDHATAPLQTSFVGSSWSPNMLPSLQSMHNHAPLEHPSSAHAPALQKSQQPSTNILPDGFPVPAAPAEMHTIRAMSNSTPEELIKALGPVPTPSTHSASASLQPAYHGASSAPESHFDNHVLSRKHSANDIWTVLSSSAEGSANVRPFRTLIHHVSSPYTRYNERHRSPNSYHSSPGPVRDASSSGSPASSKDDSPDRSRSALSQQEHSRHEDDPARHDQRGGLPDVGGKYALAAMPPPPRPKITVGSPSAP